MAPDTPVSYHGLLERFKSKIMQVENQSPFISDKSVLGSGVLLSADGYLLTSGAVISGQERVTLRGLHNPMPFTAQVVARSSGSDTALVKMDPDEAVEYLKTDKTYRPQIGEMVFILFQAPHLGMRRGIVTSLYNGLVVTDMAPTPDTYGALMVDGKGRLIGIVSKRFSREKGYVTTASAEQIVADAKAMMKEDRTVNGFFGMSVTDLAPSLYGFYGIDRGALITAVDANMSADREGLKKGDLIVSLNGKRIADRKAFSQSLYEAKAEDNVTIGYVRNRLHKTLTMRLPVVDQSVLNPNVYVHKGLIVEELTPAIRTMREFPPYLKGVYVALVMPGTIAEAKGVRPGDVIIQVGTKTIADLAAFKGCVSKSARERIFIYRDGWNFIKLLEGKQ